MIGWADELDIEVINILADKYKGNCHWAYAGNSEGHIVMEVTGAKTKIIPVIENGELSFDVDVKVKGKYAEQMGVTSGGLVDRAYIEECEKEFAKTIEKRCRQTIEKIKTI